MTGRVWPWSRRRAEDAPPQIEDGRGQAWTAYKAAQHRLHETRAMTERLHALRDELTDEAQMNHFAERMAHAFKEHR